MLRKPPPGSSITCPPERNSRAARTDVRLHLARLPDAHLCRRHGVTITSPARTVCDLARERPYEEAVVITDSAMRRGQATRADLRNVLDHCRGWPGIRRAIRAVDFADPRAESVLETLVRLLCERYGLPAPRTQVVVGDDWGPIGRVDFFWSAFGLVGEADGMLKYNVPHALQAEKRRQERLVEAGYEVLRFTWDDAVYRPQQTARRVRAALARCTTPRVRLS